MLQSETITLVKVYQSCGVSMKDFYHPAIFHFENQTWKENVQRCSGFNCPPSNVFFSLFPPKSENGLHTKNDESENQDFFLLQTFDFLQKCRCFVRKTNLINLNKFKIRKFPYRWSRRARVAEEIKRLFIFCVIHILYLRYFTSCFYSSTLFSIVFFLYNF